MVQDTTILWILSYIITYWFFLKGNKPIIMTILGSMALIIIGLTSIEIFDGIITYAACLISFLIATFYIIDIITLRKKYNQQ